MDSHLSFIGGRSGTVFQEDNFILPSGATNVVCVMEQRV